jgi:hypothetical protein
MVTIAGLLKTCDRSALGEEAAEEPHPIRRAVTSDVRTATDDILAKGPEHCLIENHFHRATPNSACSSQWIDMSLAWV